jgi:nitrate reductase delta subunit
MARTYKALALLLSYPEEAYRELYAPALDAIAGEKLVRVTKGLERLARALGGEDMLDLQARYVQLFDRSRSLSLHLYEHVHGESRDRGQAMVELGKLYASRGLELSARELPDHLPVFLEFLSLLAPDAAAALLGEAGHVLTALRERLTKRRSPYAAVLAALVELADAAADAEALNALLSEPEDDPDDLAALDRVWAEAPVSFGQDQESGCPRAAEMFSRMGGDAA